MNLYLDMVRSTQLHKGAIFSFNLGGPNVDQVAPPPPVSPDPRSYGMDGQAIEPAVQYVQKIKQRCDPDTYRQFLDILSRYHHTPESIDEVRNEA